MSSQIQKPIVPLLDWQSRYIEDESRFKFVVASAQVGKSFGTSLEFSLRALRPKKSLGILLSASDRQSMELMEKVKMHTAGWGVAVESGFFAQTSITQHTATFPNGNRIIGLPANPDTARGYSGDVFLDEFALHRDSKAIWAAMFTRITRGYDLRVASTFKGTDNKFYELAKLIGLHEGVRPESQPVQRSGWSGHWVDLFMAREQGLAVDVEALRQAIDDEEIFLQDYCNVPISGAENFIPLEMVLACESGEAAIEWDGRVAPGLCAGYDVARKRDLAVVTLVMPVGPIAVVRGVIWMERMRFADQKKIVAPIAAAVQEAGGRFAMDATGMGAQLGEELSEEFYCVEAVDFSTSVESGAKDEKGKELREPVKSRMAALTKRRFEDGLVWIPESPKLRRAIQAVKRYVGPTGKIRFDAPRTDAGHADEFWSLALALSALEGPSNYVPASECGLVGNTVMGGGFMERSF